MVAAAKRRSLPAVAELDSIDEGSRRRLCGHHPPAHWPQGSSVILWEPKTRNIYIYIYIYNIYGPKSM